jgi:hypothetical protein
MLEALGPLPRTAKTNKQTNNTIDWIYLDMIG